MKIRLQGTREECEFLVRQLQKEEWGTVRSVSEWYQNRGTTIEGRVYIDFDCCMAPAADP